MDTVLLLRVLILIAIGAVHQPATVGAAPAAPTANSGLTIVDLITQRALQQLLSSPFLDRFRYVLDHEQQLVNREQLLDDDLQMMHQISENVSFQAFLNRLHILRIAQTAQESGADLYESLSNELRALSKYRAKLTAEVEKLQLKSELVMYQHDTIQRESDHVSATRAKLEALKQERKSRLASMVSLKNQIRYYELLISYQEDLLADDDIIVEQHEEIADNDTTNTGEEQGSHLDQESRYAGSGWIQAHTSTTCSSHSKSDSDSGESVGSKVSGRYSIAGTEDLEYRSESERVHHSHRRSQSISNQLNNIYKFEPPQESTEQQSTLKKFKGLFRRKSGFGAKGKEYRFASDSNLRSTRSTLHVPRLLNGQDIRDSGSNSFSEFIRIAELPKKKSSISWKSIPSWLRFKSKSNKSS